MKESASAARHCSSWRQGINPALSLWQRNKGRRGGVFIETIQRSPEQTRQGGPYSKPCSSSRLELPRQQPPGLSALSANPVGSTWSSSNSILRTQLPPGPGPGQLRRTAPSLPELRKEVANGHCYIPHHYAIPLPCYLMSRKKMSMDTALLYPPPPHLILTIAFTSI